LDDLDNALKSTGSHDINMDVTLMYISEGSRYEMRRSSPIPQKLRH